MTGYCKACGTEPCPCHDQRAVAAMWRERYEGCVEDVRSLEGSAERANARAEAAEREVASLRTEPEVIVRKWTAPTV